MSAEHFSGGTMPHAPEDRLDLDLYEGVEKNVVYACTDVALRDPSTGFIFLGSRQTEPQLGPWFIGGRNKYATGISENAALQVKNDLGLDFEPNRFEHIGTYSTDFPIAAPGREDHGRHTVNATMCIDLKPEEIKAVNDNIDSEKVSSEYSSGVWYDPAEIAKPDSDFPYVVKQFVRDLYSHDVMMNALHEDGIQENLLRGIHQALEENKAKQTVRIKDLEKLGFNEEEAIVLEHRAGANASYAVSWARTAAEEFGAGELAALLEELTPDQKVGDAQIKRILKSKGVTPPEVYSDNGPVLRSILNTAIKAIQYDARHEGKIFDSIKPLTHLGRPGPHIEEQL